MTVQGKIRANAAFGVTASPGLRPEPVPVSAVPAGPDFRTLWREQSDRRQAAELRCIHLRMDALGLAWALQAAANEAERLGCPPPMLTYWREMAAEIEGRVR